MGQQIRGIWNPDPGRPKLSPTNGTNEEIFIFEESSRSQGVASPGAQLSFLAVLCIHDILMRIRIG